MVTRRDWTKQGDATRDLVRNGILKGLLPTILEDTGDCGDETV